ncbi:EAL domain-containing protein [Granulosicoccus sp.]|nr:EAL domain-containing protein [Granulosicoccus sp.]MDB4223739.1 EAL domain-containing protein [Granulosicoccus sp.]
MEEINTLWKIVAIFLVLSMQAGFLLLEGGRVRSKNSINVAQKNVTDLVLAWVCFFAIGFTIMFGVTVPELLNTNPLSKNSPDILDFIFQFCFCCTTATVLSGAVSERISFRAYLALVVVVTAFVYPLVGQLVWGNIYNPEASALLADIGFIDFAGSTVVHGVGAWFGLVALIMLGPRIGRFDENGNVQTLAAHNSVIALYGVLILLFGWIGFNGGTLSMADPLLKLVIFNTISSAVFGAACGMSVGVWLDKGLFNPSRVATGMLGGLVACTAGVHFMSGLDAVLVGLVGGGVATYGAHILLHRFKLDDPVDAIATHGLAGVFGTLAVAFIAPESSLLAGSRLSQFFAQLTGVVTVFLVTAISCWVSIVLIRRFMDFRVTEQSEKLGLNYTEHGENVGLVRLQQALQKDSENAGRFGDQAMENVDDEHSELASALNKMLGKYETANKEIKVANERFQQFAETASDWLWETDTDLALNFINANSEHASYLDLDKVLGQNLLYFLELDEPWEMHIQELIHKRQTLAVFEAQIRYDPTVEANIVVEVRGVPYFDTDKQFLGYRGTVTDISARKEAENRALFLSNHDELTGLSNRRALTEHLAKYLKVAEGKNQAIVVAGVDLDGFKGVNDAYGHLTGDILLQQVASRLEKSLRLSDYVYRTGGDEFVVVLTELDPETACQVSLEVMQRLIENVSALYYVQTIDIRIGASVGIVSFPDQGGLPEDLLRMADLALYEAKARGKGCVVGFDSELDVDAKQQLKIEADLHKAIEDEEFYLVYQPQVDSQNNRIMGFEALVRWEHPERGEIPPGDFISVAEKLNLMDEIGTFVLDSACKFAATWPLADNGSAYQISVNVSPQQFRNADFCKIVKDTLERHQLPPERLELEITEDVLVHDFQVVSKLLLELREMKVAVAIDDFGSGQTSLRYLNQFPISTIKIDRSFIKHLMSDDKAAEITQTIVGLGQRLGVKVLAEGVEDKDQLSMLESWNCDQIQGFLFSKPLSAENTMRSMDTGDIQTSQPEDGKYAA